MFQFQQNLFFKSLFFVRLSLCAFANDYSLPTSRFRDKDVKLSADNGK